MDAHGFGVFDPGINALSIATATLPGDLCVEGGTMTVPKNRASPIAAAIALRLGGAAPVMLDLNFLQTGPQRWDIAVETNDGMLELTDGGKRLFVNGEEQAVAGGPGEYPRIYARFAALIRAGESDVDLRPLRLVEDIFRIARRERGEAFHF